MQNQPGLKKGKKINSIMATIFLAAGAAKLAALTAWIAYSRLFIDHDMLLPDAVRARRKNFLSGSAGRLSYYVDDQAQDCPLVLIHSINAAASAYELSPIFNALRHRRPVYALDLPGFGFSERSRRSYSPKIYTEAILDFIETQVGKTSDVVALSLGCEFTALAALQKPALFNSLAFISPTGLGSRADDKRMPQRTNYRGSGDFIHQALSFGLWGRPIFDLLTTRASIQYFLSKSFVGPVPLDLVEYDYLSAHQLGAEHAPLHFISGKLFTPKICSTVYQYIKPPTLVIYDRDYFTRFDMLPGLMVSNPVWRAARIIPTQGLPQFEQLPELLAVLEDFWQHI